MQMLKLSQEYGNEDLLRLKWMHIWNKVEQRFKDLPEWAQDILLKDISSAVENRVAVMQKAKN
jgi:hypothetical protein